MGGSNKAVAVWQAMDENVSSRCHAQLPCAFSVDSVGIGNVQRAMKLAVRVSAVDHIDTLRSPMISLSRLRTHRLASEGDLISLKRLACAKHALVDDDAVGTQKCLKG